MNNANWQKPEKFFSNPQEIICKSLKGIKVTLLQNFQFSLFFFDLTSDLGKLSDSDAYLHIASAGKAKYNRAYFLLSSALLIVAKFRCVYLVPFLENQHEQRRNP